MNRHLAPVAVLLLALPAAAADRPDLLVANFEGADYGGWKATGDAFGSGPARGTLPDQMPVTGFRGKGYANSYHGGDKSTGTLTSPPVKIERKFLSFLVGGGKFPGKTCVDLLVDGKVVRTATGPNDKPGGSEGLDWQSWDVADLEGKSAVVRLVDDATGGWGHVTADHFVQSDRKRTSEPARREFTIDKRYLNLPVKTGATPRRVRFLVGGETVREFDIELAEDAAEFWAFADVSAYKGKTLTAEVKMPDGPAVLATITQADAVDGAAGLYREKLRPGFHFTSRRGWLNDPNGMVYSRGEYHLFYQHNPFGRNWGNMHWGHAVSKDLAHWEELPVALYPRRYDDWAFSGSAVVDHANTSGFGTPENPPLVLAYTSTGRGECIASSTDRGRSWQEYDGSPVVKHVGRDPRLLWHAPSKRWVMAVYDEHDKKQWVAFYTSPDLKQWTFRSRIEGFFECPDLFELPVGGTAHDTKWVLSAADGKYALGAFDGEKFTPDAPGKQQVWYGNFYAAQTFSDAPDGRRVQIGWGNGITFPGMPFNQQMTVPCELSLRPTGDGVRLFAEPVKELDTLREKPRTWDDRKLTPDDPLNEKAVGELLDISAEFGKSDAAAFGLVVHGFPITYDAKAGRLTCNAVAVPLAGLTKLRVLVDRGSVEVFADGGRVAVSVAYTAPAGKAGLEVFSRGGTTALKSLAVSEMKSAWPAR